MAKRVVFIPGFPASTLVRQDGGGQVFPPGIDDLAIPAKYRELLRRLAGPDDPDEMDDPVQAGEPIRRVLRFLGFDLGKQAQSLYDLLAKLGYDVATAGHVAPVGWDWRLPVDHPQVDMDVASAFAALSATSADPVVVIAHSTGGLVLRAFLARNPAMARRIERVIAIGVPWAGVLRTLDYAANGGTFDGLLNDPREGQGLICRSWAAFDLFPPDPARTDLTDAWGVPLDLFVWKVGDAWRQRAPLAASEWLDTIPVTHRAAARDRARWADDRLGARTSDFEYGGVRVPVTNIIGWGARTETRARLVRESGKWRVLVEHSRDGDATVPKRSAAWLRGPNVTTWHVPYGLYEKALPKPHSQLWGAPPARALLGQLLGGAAPTTYFWAALDPDDAEARRSPMLVRVVARAADGQGLPDATIHVVRNGTIFGPWMTGPGGALDLPVDRKMWWDLGGQHMITVQLRQGGQKVMERDLGFWK